MKHSLSKTLPGFKTRVRYEFNRLESNCTWSRPYQLVAAFRESESVDSRRSFVARKFSRGTSWSLISLKTLLIRENACDIMQLVIHYH